MEQLYYTTHITRHRRNFYCKKEKKTGIIGCYYITCNIKLTHVAKAKNIFLQTSIVVNDTKRNRTNSTDRLAVFHGFFIAANYTNNFRSNLSCPVRTIKHNYFTISKTFLTLVKYGPLNASFNRFYQLRDVILTSTF